MHTLIPGRLEVARRQLDLKTIQLDLLTPVIGAVVQGADLSKSLSNLQVAEIREALNVHHVLIFRDQTLTVDGHKRFAHLFGELHVHPYHDKNTMPDHVQTATPDLEVLIVKADRNSRHVAGEVWHADVTCDVQPPMGSMLYITEMPEIGGGDTCFISMVHAYNTLSPAMQKICEGLTATHDGAKAYLGGYGLAAPEGGWPKASHPVVIRHPESGEKALFVNRGFTTSIDGFTRKESDAFLEMLWQHIETQVESQCRVRWYRNTLTFWDNRVTQHHSVWDYFPHSRYGQRVSIVGERPKLW